MTARATLLLVLATSALSVLGAGAARAEESEAKKAVQKARERAEQALDTAEEKTERAVETVKDAKRKVVAATAETKQAAERAADHVADHVADKAEQAAAKVGELKAEAEAAADKAKTEAETAAHEAENTIRVMKARTHELVREAVGPTGDNARRNAVRRSAWRELAKNVDRPDQLPPNVREELRRHAQRVARLRRIRTLASQKSDAALVARADGLIAREEARHKRKLDTFWAARDKPRPSSPATDDEQDPPDEIAEEEEEQQP